MLNLLESLCLLITIFFILFILNKIYNTYTKQTQKQLKMKYMGSILIFFGILKLYDIEQFVKIFEKYDIIAQKYRFYGYMYPFIEILLGYCFFSVT